MLRILFIALARTDHNIKRKPKLAVSVLKFAPLIRKMKTTPATDKIKKNFCSKLVYYLRKTDAKKRVKSGQVLVRFLLQKTIYTVRQKIEK